jgi:hypothetical protein
MLPLSPARGFNHLPSLCIQYGKRGKVHMAGISKFSTSPFCSLAFMPPRPARKNTKLGIMAELEFTLEGAASPSYPGQK